MRQSILLLVVILFSSVVSAQTLNDLTWMTEEYPPYNFTENGQVKGIGVDVLLEVWKRAGIHKTAKDISVIPWARGVSIMEKTKGSCLFSTTISPKRKKVLGYQFVYPIPLDKNEAGNHIIAMKSQHIKITSPDDLKKYRIGAVLGDIGQDLASDAKVPDSQIDTCTNGTLLIKKMLKKRFDVMSYGYPTLESLLKEEKIDKELFEIVYTFPPLPMGYAFNKDTDPALIKELQKALDSVHADGTAEKIRKKYLSH